MIQWRPPRTKILTCSSCEVKDHPVVGPRLLHTSGGGRYFELLRNLGILSPIVGVDMRTFYTMTDMRSVGALKISLAVCADKRLSLKTGSSNVATQLISHRHQLLSITRRDLKMRQKTPEEIEAMALEAPSTAPAVSEIKLFGADDRDRYYLKILRVRPSDRRKYCLVTHHDRINEMTLTMRFPHKRNEAGVISFKISFEGASRYQGDTISVAFSDLYRQPHPNRAFDRWVFKVDRHDVSFERYSTGRIYTILLPVAELWKFAGDWRISSNMTLQGEAHEDLGNMVLEDSECGYKALVDNWPQNR